MIPYISFFYSWKREARKHINRCKPPFPQAAGTPTRNSRVLQQLLASRDHTITCSGSFAILGYPAPPLRTGRGGRERERKKKREARERTGKCEKKNRKKRITTFTVTQASSLECGFCRNALLRQESMRIRPKRE